MAPPAGDATGTISVAGLYRGAAHRRPSSGPRQRARAHAAGARSVQSLAPGPTGLLRRTGYQASEPTIGVNARGTLFFVGFEAATSKVLRSRDDGRTWELTNPLTPSDDDGASLDPFIYVDKTTGRLFNADLTAALCSLVSTSDDEGETYAAPGEVCHSDHQSLFTGPAVTSAPTGYPNLVYYCAIDGGYAIGYAAVTGCSKSLDGGLSWLKLSPPFTDDPSRTGGHFGVQGHCGGGVGHGAVGPDGTVYLPRGWCDQPFVGVSRDEGLTWERIQVADLGMSVGNQLEEHEASVAVDPAGNVYYTWIAQDRLPYLVISRDEGKTWSKPRMIGAPGVNEAWEVTVDTGDTGRIAFSYVGTTTSPGGPFCARTTATACVTADGGAPTPAGEYANTLWHAYMGLTVNALAADPTFYSTTVNSPDRPLMRNAQCGPNRCDIQFDFLDTVVGQDGTAYAAFVDGLCPRDPVALCTGSEGALGRLSGGPPLVGPLPAAPVAPAVPGTGSTEPRAVSRRGCLSRRRFAIRVSQRSARVTVNGERVRVRRRGARFVATVDLRGLPVGRRIVVRISVRTRRGKRSTKVRRYRICAASA